MQDVLAMVLAGGRVEELSVMTRARPKAAVQFGGQYLVIDFVMSNLMYSGVRKVGILSQYRPGELIDHIGSGEAWDFYGRDRFCEILPPYQGTERWDWYRGTADAVYQNLNTVEESGCEHVLVLSGDHVYGMDYRPLYEQHLRTEADLTAVFLRIPGLAGTSARFGVADVDAEGRLVGYEEKPQCARTDLASLTIYLFRREALVRAVRENARSGRTFQLYDEVLPELVRRGRTYAHVFDGHWSYARTIDEYHRANMDVLAESSPIPIDNWTLRTNEETLGLSTAPPAFFGPAAVVSRARVSPGAAVLGTVEGSLLAPGVTIAAGADVRDCVLLSGCYVGEGAVLRGVVADAGVRIAPRAVVGGSAKAPPNVARPEALASGVTLLGPGVQVPERCRIGSNVIVGREATLVAGQVVPDGAALDA